MEESVILCADAGGAVALRSVKTQREYELKLGALEVHENWFAVSGTPGSNRGRAVGDLVIGVLDVSTERYRIAVDVLFDEKPRIMKSEEWFGQFFRRPQVSLWTTGLFPWEDGSPATILGMLEDGSEGRILVLQNSVTKVHRTNSDLGMIRLMNRPEIELRIGQCWATVVGEVDAREMDLS